MSDGAPGGWPRPRSRFVEWTEQIDPELRRVFQFPRRWLIAVFAYASAIAGVSAIPGLRDFFGVDPVPVVAAQLLALAAMLTIYHYENLHPVSPYTRGIGALAIAFCFQLVFSTTVAFSNPPGTYVFAALPLLAIWLHVAAIGGSWRHPYPQLAHGAAMLVGLSLNPDDEHVAVFATIIPLGLAGSFISGSLTAELSGQRAALASFRSAIGAQVLAARRKDVETLSGDLVVAQPAELDARLLAGAIHAGLCDEAPMQEALARYEETRNQLSKPGYDLTCDFGEMKGFPMELFMRLGELRAREGAALASMASSAA